MNKDEKPENDPNCSSFMRRSAAENHENAASRKKGISILTYEEYFKTDNATENRIT